LSETPDDGLLAVSTEEGNPMRLARWIVVPGVVAVVAASCGGDESSPSDGGSADATLVASGTAFDPTTITMPEGGTLGFTNEDGVTHTFTMDDESVDIEVAGGESVTVTLSTAGPFHCTIHTSMTGTVEFA
jgi:plastocyanin